jgi:hypothetical protein
MIRRVMQEDGGESPLTYICNRYVPWDFGKTKYGAK